MAYRADRAALSAAAVEELVQARVREGRAPASSFAIVTPEGVVATGAAGDPLPTMDTAFRIASCTKSFTAAALLQAQAAGALALDQPLDDLLRVRVLGASRAPTLAELASMTGGIPIDDPWADRQESMPIAQLDTLLQDGVRLVREPGTRYEYSSFGYVLLGRALEVATGVPYPRLVGEGLIEPLGLTEIGFDRGLGTPIAPGFARVEGAWAEQPWAEPGAFSPLGGLIATPSALAAWASWLAGAWGDDAADDVLDVHARRGMQTPLSSVPGSPSTSYGYGLVVEDDARHGRVISHSGGYPGYGAHMRWHPASGIGVVVLENARYSGAIVPATRALQVLLDAALVPEQAPPAWAETAAAREVVEGLLRRWDDGALAAIASDNLALDVSFALRRAAVERLAVELGEAVAPLVDAAPWSDSPAHLAWSVRGARGALRCEIRMTPEAHPRLQTLDITRG